MFGVPEKAPKVSRTQSGLAATAEERVALYFTKQYRKAVHITRRMTNGDWAAIRKLLSLCNGSERELERHMREYIASVKHRASPALLLRDWAKYGQPSLPLGAERAL